MGGNATYWFINNKADAFAGFYTVSAMPRLANGSIKFSILTKEKPLYSINAKDDIVFPFNEVKAEYEQHKSEAPGWHFATTETGGHRFIYNKDGAIYLRSLLAPLLQATIK